jgi:hypothetical protein
MLSDEVKASIERSVLCWLATVDAEGAPNVSPKEIFTALDAHTLLIANLASPGTVRNLEANARVCVSFVDVFVQKGFKLRGVAERFPAGSARYDELVGPLAAMVGGAFPILDVIAVRVAAVESIVAPSYRLNPGVSEAAQVEAAMRTYGVVPRPG